MKAGEGLDCCGDKSDSETVQQQYDRQVFAEHEARAEVSWVQAGDDLLEDEDDRKGIYDHRCSRTDGDAESVLVFEEERREEEPGVAGAEIKPLFGEGDETMAANALLSVI